MDKPLYPSIARRAGGPTNIYPGVTSYGSKERNQTPNYIRPRHVLYIGIKAQVPLDMLPHMQPSVRHRPVYPKHILNETHNNYSTHYKRIFQNKFPK